MKQYKKDLIKTLFDRTKQLEKDIDDLDLFCIEMNVKNNEEVVHLRNSIDRCKNDYCALLNELLNDEESNEYFKQVYQMQNREVNEFIEKTKDHVNDMNEINKFPLLTLLNKMTILEVGKKYILLDRLYNHNHYRNCMMIVSFVKLEIKNQRTLVWFKAPNYEEFNLELNLIKDSLYTFDEINPIKESK